MRSSRAALPALRGSRALGRAGRRDQPRGQRPRPGARVPDPAEGARRRRRDRSQLPRRCSSTTTRCVVGYDELTAIARASSGREARPEVLPPVAHRRAAVLLRRRARASSSRPRPPELGLPPDELARLHAGADYYVYFVGFTPGPALHDGHARAPRRSRACDTPRTKTPPGSVEHRRHPVLHLLGGEPRRLLGARPHAAARSTIPTAADPILLRAGDHVRFRAIDRAEYDAIAAAVAAGATRPGSPARRVIRAICSSTTRARRPPSRISAAPASCACGIPPSGPMDREAFLLANRLVGNADDAAGLECTLIGPRVEFTDERLVAVTGADMPRHASTARPCPRWAALRACTAGDVLQARRRRAAGVRAYLAVSGGIDDAARARLARDLPARPAGRPRGPRAPQGRPAAAGPGAGGAARAAVRPDARARLRRPSPRSRVVLGPQDDRFTAARHRGALRRRPTRCCRRATAWARASRGAAHRAHARPRHHLRRRGAGRASRSSATASPSCCWSTGSPPGATRRSARSAPSTSAAIGQVKPGQRLRFRRVTVAEAHAMLAAAPAGRSTPRSHSRITGRNAMTLETRRHRLQGQDAPLAPALRGGAAGHAGRQQPHDDLLRPVPVLHHARRRARASGTPTASSGSTSTATTRA